MDIKKLRAIAMYLPQFHPIPENDEWWGNGFTEWTNVTKAQPLFKGHHQPQLPADLGFYDLRVPEVREQQAALAKEYGIHGFCYYHYWFGSKRLLEQPFEEVLQSGKPDFPFCLCWANESWGRGWLGGDENILIKQEYSEDDLRKHARWLAKAFADNRYIRVNNKPVFLIYRFISIPKEIDVVTILRDEISKCGGDDPYLVAIDVHNENFNYRAAGFDHVLAFKPSLGKLHAAFYDKPLLSKLRRNLKLGVINRTLKIYDYEEAVAIMAQKSSVEKIPCTLVGWDNSPRRVERGIIFKNCNPESFGRVIEKELTEWVKRDPSVDLFFINGWNEWAEGNFLEPSQQFGLGYLEAFRNAINRIALRKV